MPRSHCGRSHEGRKLLLLYCSYAIQAFNKKMKIYWCNRHLFIAFLILSTTWHLVNSDIFSGLVASKLTSFYCIVICIICEYSNRKRQFCQSFVLSARPAPPPIFAMPVIQPFTTLFYHPVLLAPALSSWGEYPLGGASRWKSEEAIFGSVAFISVGRCLASLMITMLVVMLAL